MARAGKQAGLFLRERDLRPGVGGIESKEERRSQGMCPSASRVWRLGRPGAPPHIKKPRRAGLEKRGLKSGGQYKT